MRIYDFEYDEITLSDMGFMCCEFGTNGFKTISSGSQIEFNTVSTLYGKKNYSIGAKYSNCISTTFQICKTPCNEKDGKIPFKVQRDILSWLNRENYHKFKILNDEIIDLYFNVTFNISNIEFNGDVYGFEITMISDSPFAYKEPTIINYNIPEIHNINGVKKSIYEESDVEGYIYPKIKINILKDGDLVVSNSKNNEKLEIKNCIRNEIIKIDFPTIQSTNENINNRFNWNFITLVNSFKDKRNDININLPCKMEIEYSPLIKINI